MANEVTVLELAKIELRKDYDQILKKIPSGVERDYGLPMIIDQLDFQFKNNRNKVDFNRCSPASIASAIKYCCQMGLQPGYGQGTPDVYFVPYELGKGSGKYD